MNDSSEPQSFSKLRQIDKKFKLPVKPKQRVKYPTLDDIIFHRRNVPRTRYYFTSDHEHLGKQRNVNEEQSPFILPPKSQMFAYYQCWKGWTQQASKSRRLSKKSVRAHPDVRSKDILRRLRVDVEAEVTEATARKDLTKAVAMTDVDPNYFNEVKGRLAIGERFSKQRYIEDTRQVLRTRLLTGEERDVCIRIDQQFHEENRRLESIKEKYRSYVNGFEEFLSRDHEESMAILNRANEEAKATNEAIATCNQLSKELGQVRLEVYSLEESWRTVKMCQKFLYQISPISWRIEHDWIHRSESGSSIASAKIEDLLGRHKTSDSLASLESLIEMFEDDIASARPPEIYFQDPQELIKIFRSMELQNLNALIHLESLAGPMADMSSSVTETETRIKREISEIENAVKNLEESIRVTEERAVSLENYANSLLHGVFRDLVCSESVLYLRVYVEDTYESCVGPNTASLDTYSMMRAIERIYEDLNTELDNLPYEIVRVCEREGFKQEIKTMKDAEEAAKKFELMNRLLVSLERVMSAPNREPRKHRPALRSAPIKTKSKPITTQSSQPFDDQMLFLDFFTNYRKGEDPATFKTQFPDDFDLTFKNKLSIVDENAEIEEENGDVEGADMEFCTKRIEASANG